jgi:hypothetical protein
VDFDASVAKDFKIWEALNFQFRVDAFNVINHTNFQAPSGSLTVTEVGTAATFATSSSFGKITGTQPNRTMQLSARFFFYLLLSDLSNWRVTQLGDPPFLQSAVD